MLSDHTLAVEAAVKFRNRIWIANKLKKSIYQQLEY